MKIDLNKRRQIRYLDSKHLEEKLFDLTNQSKGSIMGFYSLYSDYEMHNLCKYLDEENEVESKEMLQVLADWQKFKKSTRKKWSYENIVNFVSKEYKSINDFMISWIEEDIDKSFYKYFITLKLNERIGLYMDLIKNHNIPLYS